MQLLKSQGIDHWARVNQIIEEPTTHAGWWTLKENKKREKELKDILYAQFRQAYGPSLWRNKLSEYLNDREVAYRRVGENFDFLFWDDIDVYEGFSPWRAPNSGTSHQNIALDHSYYLNRALLDGYFLYGAEDANDSRKLELMALGEKHYPFLWEADNDNPYIRRLTSTNKLKEAFGNSRLLAYHRTEEIIRFFTKMIITLTGSNLEFCLRTIGHQLPTSDLSKIILAKISKERQGLSIPKYSW